MKAKKIAKPLELKKQTIANLGLNAMEKVKGGACTLYATGCTAQQICCTNLRPFSCVETYYTCPKTYYTCPNTTATCPGIE